MESVVAYVPAIAAVVAGIALAAVVTVNAQARTFARQTVSAAYRVGIRTAAEAADQGIDWLRSEQGIIYRHQLVARAYDLCPTTIGPVPVGAIFRLVVSRERFIRLVDVAFEEMLEIADGLEAEVS